MRKRRERRRLDLRGVQRDEVFGVLASVTDYPSWLRRPAQVRELSRDGDVRIVEVRSPELPRGRRVFELILTEPLEIAFSEVGGFRERGLAGRFELRDGQPGLLEVHLELERRGGLFDLAARRRLRRALDELADALENRLSAGVPAEAPASGRRKILEIRRKGPAFEVWYRGRTYRAIQEEP